MSNDDKRNRDRARAKAANKYFEMKGEAGRLDLGDGHSLTWGPCQDARYRDTARYKFITIVSADGKDSFIRDATDNKIIET